ncbi:hypothetical protein TWF718_007743 [Orbilia javanica]|uniref:Uncharacterized protein n=1 Tax=Orbilia javanica TaxID=47235 RepID=A0AAN8RGN9_9PEZI
MRVTTLLLTSILAAAASAQDVPASCQNVVALVTKCAPSENPEDLESIEVAKCICDTGANFDTNVVACLDAIGAAAPEELRAYLDEFKGYCSLFAGGGGGGSLPTSGSTSAEPTVTSAPTSTEDDDSEPTSTGGEADPTSTGEDAEATTTGPSPTDEEATTSAGTSAPASTSGNAPGSAAGLKVTVFGTALAAIFAAAALVL